MIEEKYDTKKMTIILHLKMMTFTSFPQQLQNITIKQHAANN